MSAVNHDIRHIVINRIDAMGDVILTLPAAIWLKKFYPNAAISFLARSYTEAIIKSCSAIDHFINWDELKKLPESGQVKFMKEKKIDAIVHIFPDRQIAQIARKAGIGIRIGITSKNYNFFNCNRLVRLSRTRSDLHEAQQNIYILKPLGITHVPTIGSIANSYRDNFKPRHPLPVKLSGYLSKDKFNLILHPKSNGNGREWDMENFTGLIKKLPATDFNMIITGSEKEHELFKTWTPTLPDNVTDLSGKMTMDELISFVYAADGLLASSTGPLHLAAALGIHALGLFPTTRTFNATRWEPIGRKAEHIESDGDDLSSISVDMVYDRIIEWLPK